MNNGNLCPCISLVSWHKNAADGQMLDEATDVLPNLCHSRLNAWGMRPDRTFHAFAGTGRSLFRKTVLVLHQNEETIFTEIWGGWGLSILATPVGQITELSTL